MPAIKLMKDCLQNRKQRIKINSSYSDCEDITLGISRWSILLFNIFLCELFLKDENNYSANYADDTTTYFVGSTTKKIYVVDYYISFISL